MQTLMSKYFTGFKNFTFIDIIPHPDVYILFKNRDSNGLYTINKTNVFKQLSMIVWENLSDSLPLVQNYAFSIEA